MHCNTYVRVASNDPDLAKGLLMPKRCVSEFTAGLLVPVARSDDNKQDDNMRMK